jgi:hypothetical protein
MDCDPYNRELHLLLGVQGPVGTLVIDGLMQLVYKLPDGSEKFLPPAQDMTPAQRAATLAELTRHVGTIEVRRRPRGRSPL